ncbi:HNH endonuclease signature motif containing protein [Brevibacterium spongiae]|uniref:HNH endonuclease n=1 Tax=Brevibacterium spongiae TaxID=2909672 RepID=A0ABY5SQG2_9MICO|nr:HNH endonuclease signature motif containing protein [Brevibacterium spongiae]UVI36161.1 HNH endonuclease [Brevibacterium spongiae]
MKDPQDPGDEGLDPASDDSSDESSNESSKESSSDSSNEDSNDSSDASPVGDSNGSTIEQSSLPTPPPLVGPESPRRLDVDPDSPMAVVASIARLSTGARIAELQAVAGLFLAEVVDRLRYAPEGEIYHHATFTETVERFITTRDGEPTAALAEVDQTEPGQTEPENAELGDVGSEGAEVENAEAEAAEPTEVERTAAAAIEPLPNFPKFQLHRSFNSWAHEFAAKEDVAELTAVLGATVDGAYNEITNALTLVFGLPKFLDRCLNGEFTIQHVLVAARAVKDVEFEYVPRLDSYLGQRRADITIETFRKSLNLKIASLIPVEDRLDVAAKRRHVDITTYADGTASVLLSGPAVELQAFYLRIEAFARAIRKGNISAFTDHDLSAAEVGEQDGIAALMFDIATRATPQMLIAVTTHDTTTGETSTKEIALDSIETGDPMAPISAGAVDRAARAATQEAEESAATGVKVKSIIKLVMPTHGQWVREQAKMMITVPYLTAVGRSELPGMFSDSAPVPADAAKALAGESPTWHRILTDPATGTPIDARSKSYHIPADVRAPLTAKWQSCSVPGCTRRAETSEIDHIIPFDHDDPARGGQTTFAKTHPLCKVHHQLKTDRKFSIRTTEDGAVEYAFSHDVVTTMYPPDNPVHAEHAWQVENYAQLPDQLDLGVSSNEDWRGARAGEPLEAVTGDKCVSDTAEAEQTETEQTEAEQTEATGESVLRYTSETGVAETGAVGIGAESEDARKTRRSREAQESIWNVSWDPENPPPF